MASSSRAWKLLILLLFLLFGGPVAASDLPPVNATSLEVGYLLEHPRAENHQTNEVVLDRNHLRSVLRLICFISPRLPIGLDYEIHKNEIAKWEKVTTVHNTADSIRYWSSDRTKTAISFTNVTFQVIGTYSCSYGGLSKSISVKVQNADIAKELKPPSNYSEVHKYVTHMKDMTSMAGWSQNRDLIKGVGTTFTCKGSITTSQSKPTSIHLVLPSDVNVVAALGDGYTRGLGTKATSWNGFFTEYKGTSWSVGGDGLLNQTTTVPNILKKFNPQVKGFSSKKKSFDLNIASVSASSWELERQVDKLAKRMQENQEIDFNTDWKVVTIWIGTFDLCHICKDQTRFASGKFIKNVMRSLNSLHKKIKRAYVNLVLPMDVSILYALYSIKPQCRLLGWSSCPCVASGSKADERSMVSTAAAKYKKLLEELVFSGIYDISDEFVVVLQPFTFNGPRNQAGDLVTGVFGPDCLHFNVKGHAAAARALWNNMLEPIGKKSTTWLADAPLNCPSQSNKYLSTKKNSQVVTGMSVEATAYFMGIPASAAIALAVVLVVVVVGVTVFVWRSRRSRPNNEALKLITTPFRPRI